MSEIKYNKRKWHIVEFNGYYAIRRVTWLGTNMYLSKITEYEYYTYENVMKYCLYNTLEQAEKTFDNINDREKRFANFIKPNFIKQ